MREKTVTSVEGGVTVQVRDDEGLTPRQCLAKEGKGVKGAQEAGVRTEGVERGQCHEGMDHD